MSTFVVTFPGQVFDAGLLASVLEPMRDEPLVQRLADLLGTDQWADLDATDASIAGPCTLVAGLLTARRLVDRSRVGAAAGHSFGEITAVAYAGGLSDEDALAIVRARGEVCREANRARPGQMIAVMGLDFTEVDWIRRVAVAAAGGVLEFGGINDRSQFVLTGDRATVEAATGLLAEAQALVVPLPIPGAFHSPVMHTGVPAFAEVVERAAVAPLEFPVYSTIDLRRHDHGEDFRSLIVRALVMPVRWREVTEALRADGFTTAVDAGPGETLAKLGRRSKVLRFLDHSKLGEYGRNLVPAGAGGAS
jgi:[acyl-carrier-protein] S-malonyltransferase